MIQHIETIRRQQPTYCLRVFDHFMGMAPKGSRRTPYKQTYEKRKLNTKFRVTQT